MTRVLDLLIFYGLIALLILAPLPYLTVDQFGVKDVSTWVNGHATLSKVETEYSEALPNMFIGGSGTVYHEMWQGDVAEIIVYGHLLNDQERTQVEDYLAKKYGVAITRP